MKNKVLPCVALAGHALMIALTVISVLGFFIHPADGFMLVSGSRCFRYFTIDSNLFCALGSLLAMPYWLRRMRGAEEKMKRPIVLLRYSGTASLTVTLLTVVFFLGPTMGYAGMFGGTSLWMHGVNPVLTILLFAFAEGQGCVKVRDVWLSVLPVALYACVYLVLVVWLHLWPDFYGFNAGGKWYVSAPLMLLASVLIGLGLIALQRLGCRRGGMGRME